MGEFAIMGDGWVYNSIFAFLRHHAKDFQATTLYRRDMTLLDANLAAREVGALPPRLILSAGGADSLRTTGPAHISMLQIEWRHLLDTLLALGVQELIVLGQPMALDYPLRQQYNDMLRRNTQFREHWNYTFANCQLVSGLATGMWFKDTINFRIQDNRRVARYLITLVKAPDSVAEYIDEELVRQENERINVDDAVADQREIRAEIDQAMANPPQDSVAEAPATENPPAEQSATVSSSGTTDSTLDAADVESTITPASTTEMETSTTADPATADQPPSTSAGDAEIDEESLLALQPGETESSAPVEALSSIEEETLMETSIALNSTVATPSEPAILPPIIPPPAEMETVPESEPAPYEEDDQKME